MMSLRLLFRMNAIRCLLVAVAAGMGDVSAQAGIGGVALPQVTIVDAGMARVFEIRLDAVAVNRDGRRETLAVAATNLAELRVAMAAVQAAQAAGAEVELLADEAETGRLVAKRRLVTRRMLVVLAPGSDARGVARDHGVAVVAEPAYAPGMAVLEAADPVVALAAMAALRGDPRVAAANVLLARQQAKKSFPNDPLFGQQWHHRNATQGGGALWIDANVTPVWETWRGSGVTIGILDDGVQHAHPDLLANYNTAIDYDFNSNDADPTPADPANDAHGTACAGVAGARGNNGIGGCGVAFEATLAGLRLIALPATDQQEADAFAHRNDVIQVKSNSWGAPDDGQTLEGPGALAAAALASGTATGRGGRGTIYVFAGGNGLDMGDNSNYDGYANSIHTIAVGAVNDDGFQAYYSERGANLMVCAPSNGGGHNQGVVTTDLTGEDGSNTAAAGTTDLADRDYTRGFGGTSAACPAVAGVCALMLGANPDLGWRDVQEILLRSARQPHHTDSDWITNGAGFRFNHKYGAGVVDAQAAVAMAAAWVNLGPQTSAQAAVTDPATSIPDDDPAGITKTLVISQANLRVEHVALTVTISHTNRGDLEVTLTSPAGTVSKLAEEHPDPGNHYPAWTFTSVRHWGETAAGNWTLTVRDRHPGVSGSLTAATLKVYGSTVGTARIVAAGTTLAAEDNLPANGAADPGERVSVAIGLGNLGPAASGAVTATMLAVGGVAAPGAARDYGVLPAGGAVVTRTFDFTAGGCCGAAAKLVLRLETGTGLLGYATCQLPLGVATEFQSAAGGPVAITDNATANPYPSALALTGITGRVQSVRATLAGFGHTYPYDASVILKGPDDLFVTLLSDATGIAVAGRTWVFDENAATFMPRSGATPSGSYRPWDPYESAISGDTVTERGFSMIEFAGLDPNGTWGIYAADAEAGDSGSIGSWSVGGTAVDCTDNVRLAVVTTAEPESAGAVTVTVIRTGGREGSAAVNYAATAGSATAGADFTAVSGTLTFAAGETTRTFVIPLADDALSEAAETILVTLSAVSGRATAGRDMAGVVTILDDDLSPLDAWRQAHFGDPANAGDGADLNDFDHDGLVNLVEYGFGLDPKSGGSRQLPHPLRTGGEYVVEFDGVAAVTYSAEWSATLQPGSWLPLADTGSGNHHRFSTSANGQPQWFVRLKVANP